MSTTRTAADASIIVAMDDHPSAARAMRWAAKLARLQGRALIIADTGPDDSAEPRLRAATDIASDLRSTTLNIADATNSAKALLALASPRSLLVVGAHHTNRLRHGYKRPIQDAVARRSRCPIVVVHPGERRTEQRGVVVGVVNDTPSAASLRFAYEYASWTTAPLTVLHCFWDVTHAIGVIQDIATAPNEHRELAEAVAGLGEDYPDVRVRLQLAHGFPEHLIVEAGRTADMVVVGSRHADWFSELIEGSLEHWVSAHAECDVVIVPVSPSSVA
jgi:nucleotide-binding universal stress UspA family protein